jgi:hypothetical protein
LFKFTFNIYLQIYKFNLISINFKLEEKMSNNSQPSENGETESLSIVGSDEVARQGKEEVEADDNSIISVPSSLISRGDGSQSGTDTASEADVDDQPDNDEPILVDDEEETASQINAEAENQGRAISNLVLFSIILFTVPLSAMYITYRFIFIGFFSIIKTIN